MPTLARTTCNRDCPDACGIVAHVEDGRVVRLGGDRDHPVTQGFLCFRTQRFLERQYSPDRLTQPLLRRGGRLEPVSWEEALDVAAERLQAFRRESGPASIFHYRSGGSLGLLKHLTDWFFESFGPVTMKRGDICSGAGDDAQMTDFGEEDSHDLFDLRNARTIVLWGKNPYTSGPHLLPLLREVRARGARIVLIDPVHHRSVALADHYVQPRPASDFAIAMGMARVLFEEGRTDPAAAEFCDHLDAFRARAFSRSVAGWAASADLAEADVRALAGLYADGPSTILVGWGMGRRANGSGIVRALDALGAISGNLGVPGGGVSFYFKRRGAFDLSFIRGLAAAPRSIAEPLIGPELLRLDDPPVRMVWITAGNPVAMLPESETVRRALASREFTVVVDSHPTDTTDLAHLVLPTTTLLEDDDLLGAYGHHWLGVARPVVPPPPGVRTDLEIMQELARRVGLGPAMAGTAREWKERLLRRVAPLGATIDALERGPVRNPLPPRVLFEKRRFATASGRVNLIHEEPPAAPVGAPGFPLQLLALSTPEAQSSQWVGSAAGDGPLPATLHPDAAPGFRDGDEARLVSRVSSMPVRLRFDPNQRRDVVLVAKGGQLRDGRCANALVRARLTDAGEGAAYYDEAVRVEPPQG
jgi:anaerobic selenocysteine-containing dehydrogenase